MFILDIILTLNQNLIVGKRTQNLIQRRFGPYAIIARQLLVLIF